MHSITLTINPKELQVNADANNFNVLLVQLPAYIPTSRIKPINYQYIPKPVVTYPNNEA